MNSSSERTWCCFSRISNKSMRSCYRLQVKLLCVISITIIKLGYWRSSCCCDRCRSSRTCETIWKFNNLEVILRSCASSDKEIDSISYRVCIWKNHDRLDVNQDLKFLTIWPVAPIWHVGLTNAGVNPLFSPYSGWNAWILLSSLKTNLLKPPFPRSFLYLKVGLGLSPIAW